MACFIDFVIISALPVFGDPGTIGLLSIWPATRYVMGYTICTAMFSEVRVRVAWCYGVKKGCVGLTF